MSQTMLSALSRSLGERQGARLPLGDQAFSGERWM